MPITGAYTGPTAPSDKWHREGLVGVRCSPDAAAACLPRNQQARTPLPIESCRGVDSKLMKCTQAGWAGSCQPGAVAAQPGWPDTLTTPNAICTAFDPPLCTDAVSISNLVCDARRSSCPRCTPLVACVGAVYPLAWEESVEPRAGSCRRLCKSWDWGRKVASPVGVPCTDLHKQPSGPCTAAWLL